MINAKNLLVVVSTVASIFVPQCSNADSRSEFFARFSELCGAVYSGYSTFPEEGPFAGKLLRAEVAECVADEIRIPFSVADDRSRTWILSWRDDELSLAHDHRHADGSPDEITMYGGRAATNGTDSTQSFPADDYTKNLIPEAATNVWTLDLSADGSSLVYSLERHQKPRFAAELRRESKP